MKLSSVSFFCPAYHDEHNLPRLIPKVVGLLSRITDTHEIIIVHDGSPDRTGPVADELARCHPGVRVIHHAVNQGYGVALHDGFDAARYDYVMYTDGDVQYDVDEFEPALALLERHDVISGYVTSKAVTVSRQVQSILYNTLLGLLFGLRLRDANCSMKVYKRRVLEAITIRSRSAFIDGEMLIKAQRAGFSIGQFPVHHLPREAGIAHGSHPTVILDTFREMLMFRLGRL